MKACVVWLRAAVMGGTTTLPPHVGGLLIGWMEPMGVPGEECWWRGKPVVAFTNHLMAAVTWLLQMGLCMWVCSYVCVDLCVTWSFRVSEVWTQYCKDNILLLHQTWIFFIAIRHFDKAIYIDFKCHATYPEDSKKKDF